jgi:uncharacterized membrane protein
MNRKPSMLLAGFVKHVTFLSFIAVLLFAYSQLPQRVTIHFDKEGFADQFISKEVLFYASALIGVVFYVSLSLIHNLLPSINTRFLLVPMPGFWLENAESRQNLYEVYQQWLSLLDTFVNVFLSMCLLAAIRSHQSDIPSLLDYGWLPWVGLLLILIWLLYLPIRLRIRNYDLIGSV